jgi:hypothetical protein
MPDNPAQPWDPAMATEIIRRIASGRHTFVLTGHASDQMQERDLTSGDILYVLKRGFVYEEAVPSTREDYYKYKIECTTPNSNNREVRVVVIPCARDTHLKIVTVMWCD